MKIFDTSLLKPDNRKAYWLDAVYKSYIQLDCDLTDWSRFSSKIALHSTPNISFSYVTGSQQRISRRPNHINQADEEYFLLSIQVKGETYLTQKGYLAHMRPGDSVLYDSTAPYELNLSDSFEHLVIRFNKNMLLNRIANAEKCVAQTFDHSNPFNQVIISCLHKICKQLSNETPQVQYAMEDTLIDLIASGITANCGIPSELSKPHQMLLLRTKEFIKNNISNTELDRNLVAFSVSTSVRNLNRILSLDNSSITQEIRMTRMARAREILTDPKCGNIGISQVAFECGFSIQDVFSRSFKKIYGLSPRSIRPRNN